MKPVEVVYFIQASRTSLAISLKGRLQASLEFMVDSELSGLR